MKLNSLKFFIFFMFAFSFTTFAFNKRCYISFSSKGGEGTMVKQECQKGATIRINPNTYTKEGCYFSCWEDDFGKTYKDQEYITIDKDIHLYANWSKVADTNDLVIKTHNQDEKIIEEIINYQKLRNMDYTIYPNKWYIVGANLWYYIDENLKPKRGWLEETINEKSTINNRIRWYYLDSDTCLLSIGWKVIDNKYYYFATETIDADYAYDKVSASFVPNGKDKVLGQMYCDEYTPDGRYVNSQGVMVDQYR